MANRPTRPRAIVLTDFEQEVLPSGRKLLHCTFKNKYSPDFYYRWTPPWREKPGEHGVESLFFEALAVEEYNDPGGVWDEELKKAAEEIPPLKEWKLPVQVECSGLTTPDPPYRYGIEVSIWSEEETVTKEGQSLIRIGACTIDYYTFRQEFLRTLSYERYYLDISSECLPVGKGYSFDVTSGVQFTVGVPDDLERQDYRVVGREIGSFVRSYIRQVLADYDIFRRSFEP